jgi:sporulation protein YlmC with PRC-barrel domain
MGKPEKILAQDLMGRELLDLAAGEIVGQVTDFAITRDGTVKLVGILGVEWYAGGQGIAPDAITSVNDDRICIEASEALTGFAPEGDELFAMRAEKLLANRHVLKDDGEMLGLLVDFAFSLTDGRITDLIVRSANEKRVQVPVEHIRTIGREYIIVEHGGKAEGDEMAPSAVQAPATVPPAADAPEAQSAAEDPVPEMEVDAEPKPVPVATTENSVPAADKDKLFEEEAEEIKLSKFDQKKKDFLLGKSAHRDIKDANNALIVAEGDTLNEQVVGRIIAADMLGDIFLELTMKK